MADNIDIFRKPTTEEKKDFIDISNPLEKRKTPQRRFLDKLREIEAEFTNAHEPFDYPCARVDFDLKIQMLKAEVTVRSELPEGAKEELEVDMGDLKKYGDKKRLKLIGTTRVMEDKLIDGIRTSYHSQYKEVWICPRGHKMTVFIPKEEYYERYPDSIETKRARKEEAEKKK